MSAELTVFVWFVLVAAIILLPCICYLVYVRKKEEEKKRIEYEQKELEKQRQQDREKRLAEELEYKKRNERQINIPNKEEPRSRTIAPSEKLKDYIVIDLETTGLSPIKNEIIEIGAVKVENSQPTEVFSELIKPKKPLTENITDLTGISNEMLENAPSINRTLPRFIEFIGDSVLVGHNVTFDSSFLSVACGRFKIPFKNKVVDTLGLSQQVYPKLYDHKLGTMCEYLNIENSNAHRALSDALATQALFEDLSGKIPIRPQDPPKMSDDLRKYRVKYTEKTSAIRELKELLTDVTSDNVLTEDEVLTLRNWLDRNESFSNSYPFDRIKNSIDKALEDGILENSELEEMLEIFKNIAAPKFDNNADSIEAIDINGKVICFTGECKIGSFEELKSDFENMGAAVRTSVSGKTDYLIVGDFGSPEWAYGNYSSTVLKAMELQEQGKKVKIVSESDFVRMLENNSIDEVTV